jgi:hypothetical protein
MGILLSEEEIVDLEQVLERATQPLAFLTTTFPLPPNVKNSKSLASAP